MNTIDANYWTKRWQANETQWDLGAPSQPLKKFIDGLTDKNCAVLIPGAGNAYEGIYMLENGFTNVTILDISPEPIEALKKKLPEHWHKHLVCGDFFAFDKRVDLIIEQTFFCALDPKLREQYVKKMHELLNDNGRLVGLLFNDKLNDDHPPFGGSKTEYELLFSDLFIGKLEECYNSIEPRKGRELFINLKKK